MIKVFLLIGLTAVHGLSHCTSSNISTQKLSDKDATVIYLIDTSQQYSKAQVKQLVKLHNNLHDIGIAIKLVIAPNEETSAFSKMKNITVDYDIWKTLEHSDKVPYAIIFDRCGRLTYKVVYPWALAGLPYIKAAILSTYHDKPCGVCIPQQHIANKIPEGMGTFKILELPEYPEMAESKNSFTIITDLKDEDFLPIDIKVKERHKHKGSSRVYEYIERRIGDPSYHKHSTNYYQNLVQENQDMEDKYEVLDHDTSGEYHLHFIQNEYILDNEDKIENEEQKVGNEDSTEEIKNDFESDENSNIDLELLRTILMNSAHSRNTKDNEDFEQNREHYRKIFNWIHYIV